MIWLSQEAAAVIFVAVHPKGAAGAGPVGFRHGDPEAGENRDI